MELTFSGEVVEWRGPAPYRFVALPPDVAADVQQAAAAVTYGWGMVPATLRVGGTTWTTSLWPRQGGYVVPLKDAVRRAEGIELGDVVEVHLVLGGQSPPPQRPRR
ncbi:DUF1905 domain-containing protein [Aquipuribacter hungaricus]|uniref:DUF1905 domain-containing protein n=1 Tax=Aquipuribacter hungaricus TaxID=545624 RepID=A0ABV7WLX7_9MICO